MNYLDTTVIVAALLAAHPAHRRSHAALKGGFSDTHAMAEAFRVLTAAYKIPASQAADAVLSLPAKFWRAVELEDYQHAVQRCADAGVSSGAVYDAVHASVARREKAGKILTHNTADFLRFSGPVPVSEP